MSRLNMFMDHENDMLKNKLLLFHKYTIFIPMLKQKILINNIIRKKLLTIH